MSASAAGVSACLLEAAGPLFLSICLALALDRVVRMVPLLALADWGCSLFDCFTGLSMLDSEAQKASSSKLLRCEVAVGRPVIADTAVAALCICCCDDCSIAICFEEAPRDWWAPSAAAMVSP